MRVKTCILTMVLMLVALLMTPVAVSAQSSPPGIPHYFYGTVRINNIDAPAGTTIEARVTGVLNGSFNPIVTTEVGKYGSANASASVPRLLVQGNINEGATIEFFVNGVKANETAPWRSGQVTVLNLTSGTMPPANPVPPAVMTANAGSITRNSAMLFATLTNPGTATAVNVSFEYGTTASYGSTTPVQVMTAPSTFSANISGLAPGTSYHFRVKADGGANGMALGLDKTFTTSSPATTPPAVATNDATGITISSANLNGNLMSLGTATSVAVSFEWGTTASGPYPGATIVQMRATEGAFSVSLSGLSANTSYYYIARAEAGVHGTSFGNEKSFITPGSTSGGGGISGGGGGGGISGSTQSGKSVKLDSLNADKPLVIDDSGKTLGESRLSDVENRLIINIPSGTIMKSGAGTPLEMIFATAPAVVPPAPSQNAVITAREFGPSGATFEPPIILTFRYSEADLPAGVKESELVIAVWDGAKWNSLPTAVSTGANMASALVSHFSVFGILANAGGTTPATSTGISPSVPSPEVVPVPVPAPAPVTPAPAPATTSPSSPTSAPTVDPAVPEEVNRNLIYVLVMLVGVVIILITVLMSRRHLLPGRKSK